MKQKVIFLILVCIIFTCKRGEELCSATKTFQVTATAYNSLAYQTNANPLITAFGDSLKPGLPYIAVSRDLLDSGLAHNTKVKIVGMDSIFIVKDKMNRRWRKRIDIYMGKDVKKAKQWGKKKVTIQYCLDQITID